MRACKGFVRSFFPDFHVLYCRCRKLFSQLTVQTCTNYLIQITKSDQMLKFLQIEKRVMCLSRRDYKFLIPGWGSATSSQCLLQTDISWVSPKLSVLLLLRQSAESRAWRHYDPTSVVGKFDRGLQPVRCDPLILADPPTLAQHVPLSRVFSWRVRLQHLISWDLKRLSTS